MGTDARIAHYGPASTYANFRGRIYVCSRANRHQAGYLQTRRSPYTDLSPAHFLNYCSKRPFIALPSIFANTKAVLAKEGSTLLTMDTFGCLTAYPLNGIRRDMDILNCTVLGIATSIVLISILHLLSSSMRRRSKSPGWPGIQQKVLLRRKATLARGRNRLI